MKELTFEEWEKETNKLNLSSGDFSETAFYLARKGMIPEDEAVRIPPVSEWPESASGVLVGYYEDSKAVEDGKSTMFPFGFFRVIPRPTPAWTPKVGDAVFYDGSAYVHVATVTGLYTRYSQCTILLANGGAVDRVMIGKLKPFDASKIGKPWEEI